MLTKWNFKDEAENSTLQQINRQKSAQNLEVLEFDPSEPRAVFFDPNRNQRHTSTLNECDCRDYNFAGVNPRKAFKPCMHIYRLAIELGLIEAKYLDHRARFARASLLSHEETTRLQLLPLDATQWGGWAAKIHSSGVQLNRQYRAYSIIYEEAKPLPEKANQWTVHDYSVTLNTCTCMDFGDRRLPCKHIYAVALASKIGLPLAIQKVKDIQEQADAMLNQAIRDAGRIVADAEKRAEKLAGDAYLDARLAEFKWAVVVHELARKQREEQRYLKERLPLVTSARLCRSGAGGVESRVKT